VSFLADTDVLSEDTKPQPSGKVNAWIEANEPRIYTSALSIGELRRGIARLPTGARRVRMEHWLEGLLVRMHGRILAYNVRVAETWGDLVSDLERKGHPMPLADSQIAAIAKRHNLTLVTRNTEDFKHSGVRLLNPFE
jgi:predicted nucleic acid-binding protein